MVSKEWKLNEKWGNAGHIEHWVYSKAAALLSLSHILCMPHPNSPPPPRIRKEHRASSQSRGLFELLITMHWRKKPLLEPSVSITMILSAESLRCVKVHLFITARFN